MIDRGSIVEDAVFSPVVFSMEGHTGCTLCNLVTMIYKMGGLLSKSTGGLFQVPEGFLPLLTIRFYVRSREVFLEALSGFEQECGRMQGLAFSGDRIIFSGFPGFVDEVHAQAYTVLSEYMVRYALKRRYPLSKTIRNPNEKYTFDGWLKRMGMMGSPDLNEHATLLVAPLSGNRKWARPESSSRRKTRLGIEDYCSCVTVLRRDRREDHTYVETREYFVG